MSDDDEPAVEMYAVPETLFDGVHEIKVIESVVRIALYAKQSGGKKIIVARLAVPVSELPDVIQHLVISLTEAAKIIVQPAMGH